MTRASLPFLVKIFLYLHSHRFRVSVIEINSS